MRAAILLILVLLAPTAIAAQERVIDVLAQQSIPPRVFAPGVVNLTLRHLTPGAVGSNVSVVAPSGRAAANAVAFAGEGVEARFENLTLDEHGGWNVFVDGQPVAAFQVAVSTPGAGFWFVLLAILGVAVRWKRADSF